MIHRRLLLHTPRREARDAPPDLSLLGSPLGAVLAFEVHHPKEGGVTISVGSESAQDLAHWAGFFESAFPGGHLPDEEVECPFPAHAFRGGLFARARVLRGHHWWPQRLIPTVDYSASLARALTSPFFRDHEVLLQVLGRPLSSWESRFHLGTSPYEKLDMHLEGRSEPLLSAPTQRVPTMFEKDQHAQVLARNREPAWHVELRVAISGPQNGAALAALDLWLQQWSSLNGGRWWSWSRVRDGVIGGKHRVLDFREAMASHDIAVFSGGKEKRNLSAREFGTLLPLPWKQDHPGLPYVGSPVSHPSPAFARPSSTLASFGRGPLSRGLDLPRTQEEARVAFESYRQRFGRRAAVPMVRPAPTLPPRPPSPPPSSGPEARPPPPPARVGGRADDLVVGSSRGVPVHLPSPWQHLVVLGRTQSGKSTLVLNMVLQILAREPQATVVVLEPTGALIEDLVVRVPDEVADETLEIDPAQPTFREEGLVKAKVPLGILHIPDRRDLTPEELARQAQMVTSDIITAIKNAWGEESVGGRVDYILGGILRGLLASDGTNLVDAYNVLTDAETRRRFLRGLPPGPLRTSFRVHLPGWDYSFTMSSMNKVGKIATNPMLSQALCQRLHPVTFEELLQRRLVLLNLAKGQLGSEEARFLGAIYLTQLWAALQRSGSKAHPVYLVLDEFQNYTVPILADMLSEGAKFGLHVVAVTQYLHQVPPEIRSALQGNVSAWMFLALGQEDAKLALEVSDARRRGWVPEHFVHGLENHQMALVTQGEFAKVQTLASPAPRPDPDPVVERVERSTRRFARIEDSQVSPFGVTEPMLAVLLEALAKGPRTREDLLPTIPLLSDRLAVTVLRAIQVGDVVEGPTGSLTLTTRGTIHRAAIAAQRNEGEEHTEFQTDVGAFLAARGIPMTIPEQRGGVLLPDGEFVCQGRTYSVEIECSTASTQFPQVVQNVRKALNAGRMCLLGLLTREEAEAVLPKVVKEVPEARLGDNLALVWGSDMGLETDVSRLGPNWAFLKISTTPGSADPGGGSRVKSSSGFTDPDMVLIDRLVRGFVAVGKGEATYQDFLPLLPAGGPNAWSEQRLGVAMDALGYEGQRKRRNGTRPRVYSLLARRTTKTN